VPLTRLPKGAVATVVTLSDESAHERNKLMALGVIPGSQIRLLQRFPSYVIQLGYTQLALDKETAARIMVIRDD
jgi:Fe2+ transport system protein FeoA